MKIEEDFHSKLKRITSVKRKKSAEKETRGLFWFTKCMI